MIRNEQPYVEKKDLHIGGTSRQPAGDSVAGTRIEGLATDMKNALLLADDLVRSNPWQTLVVVAVLSAAAGYALAGTYGLRR